MKGCKKKQQSQCVMESIKYSSFGKEQHQMNENHNYCDDVNINIKNVDTQYLLNAGRASAASTAFTETSSSIDKVEKPNVKKVLTIHSLPRQLIDMEYAVRGAIVSRAEELKRELKLHPESTPDYYKFHLIRSDFTKFHEIIPANIGNPHAVGQKPITYNRQVLACLVNPALLEEDDRESISSARTFQSFESNDHSNQSSLEQDEILSLASTVDLPCFPFPEEVKRRAQRYLSAFPSFGAYSHSKGVQIFRHDIAGWFERRDGFKCDPESIFITDGASSAIRMILELLVSNPQDGVLIPVPQYPLYSATITRQKGTAVQYFLDEKNGWKLTSVELSRSLSKAREKGINVKAIAIINPGNPTGSLLRPNEMADVIRFCEEECLVILADEVYQQNIYCEEAEFISFRKMVKSMKSKVELVSFHSSSKGVGGECGMRGGLMQLENISQDVISILYKLACVALCANTIGQAMLTCILNPPLPGQPSYELYIAETRSIFNSLKRKALYATQKLNEMEGVICQPIDGAMYAFPRILLPPGAIKAAEAKNIEPDMLYCVEMLEETGIVCVPGSGFCQVPGTYHFRVTILPSEDKFADMLHRLRKFHNGFLRKYGMLADNMVINSPKALNSSDGENIEKNDSDDSGRLNDWNSKTNWDYDDRLQMRPTI